MTTRIGVSELLVLMAVNAVGPNAYGVSIRQAVAASRGREVSSGAVHTTLERLARRGLVTSRLGEAGSARGGRPRRFYTVTPAGELAIRENYGAVRHLAARVAARLTR